MTIKIILNTRATFLQDGGFFVSKRDGKGIKADQFPNGFEERHVL